MFPVTSFAAILNPPQAAILAIGRAEQCVVMEGGGQLRTVTTCSATLTVDQSRVQGAAAAHFLEKFVDALQHPAGLV
jgi:pyruvate dehydrogenase E2 component (dihydrolipoamide acetyltransferase)